MILINNQQNDIITDLLKRKNTLNATIIFSFAYKINPIKSFKIVNAVKNKNTNLKIINLDIITNIKEIENNLKKLLFTINNMSKNFENEDIEIVFAFEELKIQTEKLLEKFKM